MKKGSKKENKTTLIKLYEAMEYLHERGVKLEDGTTVEEVLKQKGEVEEQEKLQKKLAKVKRPVCRFTTKEFEGGDTITSETQESIDDRDADSFVEKINTIIGLEPLRKLGLEPQWYAGKELNEAAELNLCSEVIRRSRFSSWWAYKCQKFQRMMPYIEELKEVFKQADDKNFLLTSGHINAVLKTRDCATAVRWLAIAVNEKMSPRELDLTIATCGARRVKGKKDSEVLLDAATKLRANERRISEEVEIVAAENPKEAATIYSAFTKIMYMN